MKRPLWKGGRQGRRDSDVRWGEAARQRLPPGCEGRFPVLMTLGPYGKDVHMKEFQPGPWEYLNRSLSV